MLSADDYGRIAEMTVLARKARNRDHKAHAELVMLTEYMGLRGNSPDAQRRLEAVKMEVLGMTDVEMTLDAAVRGNITDTQRALAEKHLAIEHEEHLRRQQLHDGPLSVVDEPGQRISRERLAQFADVAARLRRVKSAQKLAELRAQTAAGHMPVIAKLQLGAGASLAGRDPSALLVDARGRWQNDASANLAQVGQQLHDLLRASFGDVREVAGPGERVPIEAIRFWEDSLAVQGDVIDGYGTTRRVGEKLVLDIQPSDGSPKVTVELRDTSQLATGFPSEAVPGGAYGIAPSEAVFELERRLETLSATNPVAAETLARLRRTISVQDRDISRVRDVLKSAGKELERQLIAMNDEDQLAANEQVMLGEQMYQSIEGQGAWNDLMAQDSLVKNSRRIFFSKEVNDQSVIKNDLRRLDDIKRTWVFAGSGGNAVSGAENVLANSRFAEVVLVARGMPAGLFENPQFKAMAERHGDQSVVDEAARRGIRFDISKSDGRLKLSLNKALDFSTPRLVTEADGQKKIELMTRVAGKEDAVAFKGDVLVTSLGSPAQLPSEVTKLALDAWRRFPDDRTGPLHQRPVWAQADFTADGRYVGYTLHIRLGETYQAFEIRGASSRSDFAPTGELRRLGLTEDEIERMKTASTEDAPSKGGSFAGGLAPTALQASQQHLRKSHNGMVNEK